ncbi:tetratricopeptide repeat protein [Thermodesulfobacteriota bacterium]
MKEDENTQKPGQFARWFILLFLLVALWVLYYSGVVLLKAANSAKWPSVSGKIISSTVAPHGEISAPEVIYGYSIAKKNYQGRRLHIGPYTGFGYLGPKDVVRKYFKGKAVVVYYDPKKPDNSVLEPGIRRDNLILLLVGGFFTLLGIFAYRHIHSEKRPAGLPESIPAGRLATRIPGGPTDQSPAHLARPPKGRLGLILFLYFIGLIGYLFWPQYSPWLEKKGIIKSPIPPVSDKRKKPVETQPRSTIAPKAKGSKIQDSPEILSQAKKLKKEALTLVRNGDYAAAERLYRKRLALYESLDGPKLPAMPAVYSDLGFVLLSQGKLDEAQVYYYRAITTAQELEMSESYSTAHAMEGLAETYLQLEDFDQAEKMYKESIQLWNRLKGPGNANTLSVMENYVRLLDGTDRPEEATALRREIAEGRKKLKNRHRAPKKPAGPVAPRPGLTMSPFGSSDERQKRKRLSVSITKDFVPGRWRFGSSWRAFSDLLSDGPPAGIIKEPHYQGNTQKYGRLALGTGTNKAYAFVLDREGNAQPVLYFDRNQNNDLTDDGGPIHNQGTGLFATEIKIPLRQLVQEMDDPGDFSIWFFVNASSWKRNTANHYSRTSFKGKVTADGIDYLAFLAERGLNDADFTNDGIYIDLNRNGKIERPGEYIQPGHLVTIDGQLYACDIRW